MQHKPTNSPSTVYKITHTSVSARARACVCVCVCVQFWHLKPSGTVDQKCTAISYRAFPREEVG